MRDGEKWSNESGNVSQRFLNIPTSLAEHVPSKGHDLRIFVKKLAGRMVTAHF